MEQQKVGLVALLETKVKQRNITEVGNRMLSGWTWYTNVEYNPKVRIWIAWKRQAYHVQVLNVTEQLIHYRIIHQSTQRHFYMTFVYGKNSITLRPEL